MTCHLVVKHKIRNKGKIISFEIKYSTFPLPALFLTANKIETQLQFTFLYRFAIH